MADTSQKTEKPTPRRLLKARSEGQFASSKDMISGLQFLVFLLILGSFGPVWMNNLKQATRSSLATAFSGDLTPSELAEVLSQLLRHTLVPMLTAGAILVGTSLAFQLASTRLGFGWKKLAPSFKQFNPINKLKGIPTQGLPSALQAIMLLALFGAVLTWLVTNYAESFLLLSLGSLEPGLKRMWSVTTDVLWKIAALYLAFGFYDFFRQNRKFMKQMKMSKQELRDESKESEGNPQTKMRIRRLQRDIRRRKMMSEVATATAVIVNPTHYAVAIRYRHDTMSTPLVVAKGKNFLAARIRQRAVENQVPLIENPPLAQALYKSVDVGQEIPAHLYRAVAEILAYIYKLTGSRAS